MSRARDWAVRCGLELSDHSATCFATLTYAPKYCPPTLSKDHLQRYLKRLRKRLGSEHKIRFFASGEYGEENKRPHYHAILFGLNDHPAIHDCWGAGFVRVDPITPARIAYCAGYTAKKSGYERIQKHQLLVDPETGEEYLHQPPFLQMSRNPGIGASARRHWTSWRTTAIKDGRHVPVPRYLHEAWKQNATPEQLAHHEFTVDQRASAKVREANESDNPMEYWLNRIEATRAIDAAKQRFQSEKRKL